MFLSNNAFCSKLCLLYLDLNDFVIYATGGTLYTKSLASEDGGDHNELTIPVSRTGDDAVSSVTFDYNNSCIYWIDTTINAIQVKALFTLLDWDTDSDSDSDCKLNGYICQRVRDCINAL